MSHTFFQTAQGERERRIPRSGDALGCKSASQGANGQAYAPSEVSGILFFESQVKGKTIFGVIGYYVYGKIRLYARPKIATTEPRGGGWFKREIKFLVAFLAFISFLSLFFSKNTFALYTPTLSASVDQANLQVNGNSVINSTDKTTEIPFNFTVNTNNRTGYTVTLSSETENTALINTGSAVGAKIDSISTNLTLNNLSNNTWGYKFGVSTNYAPIPALSTPAQIIQTTGKTNGNESNQLSIGMKLSENLESGNYTNKLVISIISNPYERRAVMERGVEFSGSIDRMGLNGSFEDAWGKKEKIKHVYASSVAPELVPANAKNVEDRDESDYEIKVWYSQDSQTLYYWTDSNKIYLNKDSSNMFRKFTQTIDIDLSRFDFSEVIDASRFFSDMRSLESLDLGNINTQNVTNMDHMFSGLLKLTSLNLSSLNTKNVANMRWMFSGDEKLQSLNLQNFDTANVADMSHMFHGVSQLNDLNLSNFHTQNVKNMTFMFHGMANLLNLNLSNFNTQKVEDMSNMFNAAKKLKTLDLTSFNTLNVKSMYGMFYNMYNLETLLIPNFNTENVTNMNRMFYGVMKINSLDLSNFNTSKVIDMDSMFAYMPGLANINLLSFNTENVEDMSDLFRDSNNLVTIDLSSFNTKKVKDMSYMFSVSNSPQRLKTIYVSDNFITDNVTNWNYVFAGQVTLRGGNGSYLNNPSLADKSWLRIDDLVNGRPGYFTRKT